MSVTMATGSSYLDSLLAGAAAAAINPAGMA